MINRLFFTITSIKILTIIPFVIFALQDSTTNQKDFLIKKLKNSPRDTGRIKILHDLAETYLETFPDSAILIDKQALELAKEMNYKVGLCFEILGNDYFDKKGEFDVALNYFEKALKIHESENDIEGMGFCYDRIGSIYIKKGQKDKAITYLQKGFYLSDSLNNHSELAHFLNLMGVLYTDMGFFPKAEKYLLRSIHINDSVKDYWVLSLTYNNLARLYESTNEIDRALENYLKGHEIAKENGFEYIEGITSINIGKIYINKAEYQLSDEYYQRGLIISKKIKNLEFEAICNLFMGISALRQLNSEKALILGLKALVLTKRIESLPHQITTYQHLAETSERLGAFRDAYFYQKEFKELTDSLQKIESLEKMLEAKNKFEKEKYNKEIEKLKSIVNFQKLALKKETLIRNALISFIFLSLMGFIFKRKFLGLFSKIIKGKST